ncbi:MAG: endolytic transglycosylase MltG [Acidobacteria bacterium]|nr:endolytic transglycosylase MltG [Acidobacteriota bacterium]
MAGTRIRAVLLRSLVALFLIGAVVGALALAFARSTLEEPFQAFPGSQIVVTIPSGASVREGLRLLEDKGVIADQRLARLYWRFTLENPVLIAGEYLFRGPAATPEVLAKVTRGEVLTHRVTLLEGLTFDEIAMHLSAEGFGSYEAFLSEMSSPLRIRDLDENATDLEGYLFPDTYAFARGTTESQIVDTLVTTSRERFLEARSMASTGETSEGSTNALALTLREVVILASIIEKEALLDQERPIIAGVYANRLGRGMGLYADPTIIYALKRLGKWDGNLRRRDLEMDSPYNTYRSVGLPPGPICSPGLASLAAAMAPADVPHLYFVSRNDGSHVFARTLTEHNRNVYQWQKLYWRQRWAENLAENPAKNPEGEEVH